jgi:hypothetical protein
MMKRRLACIVTALALSTGAVLTGGLPASAAAATCHNWGCYGQDDLRTNCNQDAQIVAHVAWAELMYSHTCEAAWVRGNPGIGASLTMWVQNVAGQSESVQSSWWGGLVHSAMVPDWGQHYGAEACTDGGPQGYECTGYVTPPSTGSGTTSSHNFSYWGTPTAYDTNCPWGPRYWANGVSGNGTWGAGMQLTGLPGYSWVHIFVDVRCDGTATNALYEVSDANGNHWFRVNQLTQDFADLGYWETNAWGNVLVQTWNGSSPGGQVVATGFTIITWNS